MTILSGCDRILALHIMDKLGLGEDAAEVVVIIADYMGVDADYLAEYVAAEIENRMVGFPG